MKSKSSPEKGVHLFFLLFAMVQLAVIVQSYVASRRIPADLTTEVMDTAVIDAFTLSLQLFGFVYVLLLCTIAIVAARNLTRP